MRRTRVAKAQPAPQPIRTRIAHPALLSGLLLIVCAAVYLPVFRAGFIWDDDILVTGNRLVRSAGGLAGIWRGEVNPDYFPLTSTLFWLECRLWGINPVGYHCVNLLLHAVAAILLWRVLHRLRLPWPWLTALIFAVHPVAVGTVAWIAEGKNTLSMVLALGSLLEYLKWRGAPANGWLPYAFAFVLFLLALLSKTAVVTLPAVFLLCDWWRQRTLSRRDLRGLLPFLALSLLFGLVTVWFQGARAIAGADIPMGGPFARLCIAGKDLWFYAFKLLAPIHLAVIYPAWSVSRVPLLDALPGLLILLAFGLAWKWRRTVWGSGFLFGFGIFCVTLLPVVGLVKMYYLVFAPVADHLQYLAMPAFLALAVGAANALAENAGAASAMPWVLGGSALLLGTLSTFQSAIYKDKASLWSFTLRENPDSFEGHYGLSLVLFEEGKLDAAIQECREAVRLNPAFLTSHLNLAIMLDHARRLDESIAEYREAVRVEPRAADPHLGLGNVLLEKGLPAEAAAEYREAIRLNPGNSDAHQNLGAVLGNAGQIDAAIEQYRIAARLSPDNPVKRTNLGIALYQQNRAAEAATEFEAVVRLTPGSADAHNNLGAALLKMGRVDEARLQFQEALRIDPGNENARRNLAGSIGGG